MLVKKRRSGGDGIRTEYLLKEQIEHVLAALTPTNALVMRVCLHTGLRLSDVLALKTKEVKPNFWVTERKTGKRKQIGIPDALRREILAQAGEVYVFPNKCDRERHRTRQAVWRDVKRAANAFRLPQNVAPHSARKVYAVDLMKKYGDLEHVRKVLNHRYESTTMIYAMADMLLEQGKGRRRKRE